MYTIKGLWKNTNGSIYFIESDTLRTVAGGAGPLDPNNLRDLDEYEYDPAIIGWLQHAAAEHRLHRVNIPKTESRQRTRDGVANVENGQSAFSLPPARRLRRRGRFQSSPALNDV